VHVLVTDKVPLQQKLGAVVFAIVAICAGTYFLSVADKVTKIEEADAQVEKQEAELLKLQQQAQHRTQFMREVERLKQRLREIGLIK
jgi:cell shape-determining protein MreC